MAREVAARIALLWLGMVPAASSAAGLVPSPFFTAATSAAEDEDAASGTWLVQITLRQGSVSRVFEAVLVYGP